jgi:hypothetical protein
MEGVQMFFFLNNDDVQKIQKLELKDEVQGSRMFGTKKNIGVRQVLESDLSIAFLTNRNFEWPVNTMKLMLGDNVIGKDVTDPVELKMYKKDSDYYVLGNIVLYYKKFLKLRSGDMPLNVVINPKRFPEMESVPYINNVVLGIPSPLTDNFVREKAKVRNKDLEGCIGSFLLGLNTKRINKGCFLEINQVGSIVPC